MFSFAITPKPINKKESAALALLQEDMAEAHRRDPLAAVDGIIGVCRAIRRETRRRKLAAKA